MRQIRKQQQRKRRGLKQEESDRLREEKALPERRGSSARRHHKVWPVGGAAAGASRAVLQAGGFGRQGADVSQVARGHRAVSRATRRDVAVQHLAVHHGLLALLETTQGQTRDQDWDNLIDGAIKKQVLQDAAEERPSYNLKQLFFFYSTYKVYLVSCRETVRHLSKLCLLYRLLKSPDL